MKSIITLCTVLGLTLANLLLATTCYTNCKARFPKWYQEWDRKRCQAEKAVACLESSKIPAPQNLASFAQQAEELSLRLTDQFLEGGYVVSRRADGSAMHVGDSLLWTSLTLASQYQVVSATVLLNKTS